MIGNSHIDPVWFWDWEEGMQEVKATFLSALERLREFPEMKFTCTSTAFLEWFEKVEPERFEEIRQRAAEGRWELTGGWFVEPDCTLPSGEAFVRQGAVWPEVSEKAVRPDGEGRLKCGQLRARAVSAADSEEVGA